MKSILYKFSVVFLIFTVLCCFILQENFADLSINALAQETKEFSNISIDDDFDNGSVLVVLDEGVGGINKIHNKSYFGDFGIESIVDVTYMEGNIQERKYFDQENFKQILQLNLIVKTKENVLSVLQQLEAVEGVCYACPNYYEKMNAVPENYDVLNYDEQWGLHGQYGINAEDAWNITTGNNIRVGIIDSGIANHPDLNANLVEGWDFYNGNNVTNDDPTGHGTHVAGIIGATGSSNNGMIGVCWDVELVPLQVVYWSEGDPEIEGKEDDNEGWRFDALAVSKAIVWAINNNIPILNYSGGGYTDYLSVVILII